MEVIYLQVRELRTPRFIGRLIRWAVATDSRQILVSKAAELIGRQQLARGLNISPALLDSWINGTGSMPDGKLSALANLLLEEISNAPKQ